MAGDPFGFDKLAVDDSAALDIAAFAPKPRPTNHGDAKAVREVARMEGFTRRAPAPAGNPPAALPVGKARKRRVNITELLGIQDRYPETERAQLNMLAPVPIVLRWRRLVTDRKLPAWETLEAAMEALETARKNERRWAPGGAGEGGAPSPPAPPTVVPRSGAEST